MANAKILKSDRMNNYLPQSATDSLFQPTLGGGGLNVEVSAHTPTASEPHDETWVFENANELAQPSSGDRHIALLHDTDNSTEDDYYNWVFRVGQVAPYNTSIDFIALVNLETTTDSTTYGPADLSNFTLKAIDEDSTFTVSAFDAGISENLEITTTAAHGLSVGDYVTIEPSDGSDYLLDDTTPGSAYAYIGNCNNRLKPIRVSSVPSATAFEITHYRIYAEGLSSSLEATATVRTFTVLYTSALADDKSVQIFEPPSAISPSVVFLEYYTADIYDVGTEQEYLSLSRVILGEWFEPSYNVQPNAFFPINKSERLQMSDGSYRSESLPTEQRCEVEWRSLTETEWLTLREIISDRARKLDVFFTMFPGHATTAWEEAHRIYGTIIDHDQSPLVENSDGYWTSVRMEIEGVLY